MTVLSRHDIEVAGLAFDTMLAAHLGGRKALDLKALAIEQLGVELTPVSDLLGAGRKQITMAQAPIEDAASFAAANAEAAFRLPRHTRRGERAQGDQVRAGRGRAAAGAGAGADADERRGAGRGVCWSGCQHDLGEQYRGRNVRDKMFATVGHEFNPGSSQQLGDVLFKELTAPDDEAHQDRVLPPTPRLWRR